MAGGEHSQETQHAGSAGMTAMVNLLERLDNLFHLIVGILFILMAAGVLAHSCIALTRQVPALISFAEGRSEEPAAVTGETPNLKITTSSVVPETHADRFLQNSIDILSNILLVVIILELLRTILTYLQTHNIQAIMQEFIVVGIISSVRKILLVGAESSLSHTTGIEFIREATGTILSIGGILLLILGLVLLQRAFGSKKETV